MKNCYKLVEEDQFIAFQMLHISSLLVFFLAIFISKQESIDLDGKPLEEGKFEYIDLDGNPLKEGHFNGTPPLELQSIYEDAYKANVSYDDLAELAESLTPLQTDLRLRSIKMFKNGTIDQLEEMIRELKSGTLYGCNGFYAGFSEELHFTVTCHHNYTDPSEFLNKTFRQAKQ